MNNLYAILTGKDSDDEEIVMLGECDQPCEEETCDCAHPCEDEQSEEDDDAEVPHLVVLSQDGEPFAIIEEDDVEVGIIKWYETLRAKHQSCDTTVFMERSNNNTCVCSSLYRNWIFSYPRVISTISWTSVPVCSPLTK
jgi:hypothetical protein